MRRGFTSTMLPQMLSLMIETIRSQGTPAEIEVLPGLAHGFGLGTGTSAEGWLDHAIAFWEENT